MRNFSPKDVRLSHFEIESIKKAILNLDFEASIYLFGSRTDLLQKGGDIDLLILSEKLQDKDKIEIRKAIFSFLEEQKIDIIIAKDDSEPFVSIALETGKKL